MANDSSFRGTQFPFDLDSQSGVMRLLAAIRASALDPQQKNELRDLVFSYANGGHDPSTKITIEQKVSAHGIEPLPLPEVEAPVEKKPTYAFGTSRPSPTFATHSATKKQESSASASESITSTHSVKADDEKSEAPQPPKEPEVRPVQSTPPAPQAESPEPPLQADRPVTPPTQMDQGSPVAVKQSAAVTPPPAREVSSQGETQPESATPEAAEPAPVAPVAPNPEPEPRSTSVDMVAPPQPAAAAPTNQTPPLEITKPAASPEVNRSLQRIREIKSLVNEKVGNPVNLVDIDNEVGREYMAALLDAMKKINTGSSASEAMNRLEAAFVSVESTLERHAQAPKTTEKAPKREPVVAASQPPQESVEQQQSPANEIPSNIPVASTQSSEPQAMPKIDSEPAQEQFVTPAPSPSAKLNDRPQRPSVAETLSSGSGVPRPEASPEAQREQEQAEKRVAEPLGAPAPIPARVDDDHIPIESAWGPTTDTLHPDAVKPPQNNQAKVSSVGQSGIKLRTPSELPLPSSIETSSVAGDPLYTKEVDNGLNQLLVEWSLFKKSGLFGTGPKGREHPLFQKIKELQIPLLLAGRFEGATQEIKQSITDYMNGWRYEQGIIYEQGETFEHYLRRVIRHILDLQKG